MNSHYKYIIGSRVLAFLALCCWQGCTTAESEEPQPQPQRTDGYVEVDVALSVSTTTGSSNSSTRMASTVVRPSSLGMQDCQIIPFSIPISQDSIKLGDQPNASTITGFTPESRYYMSYNQRLPIGTNAFLCYARAQQEGSYSKANHGSISMTGSTLSDTRFALDPIRQAQSEPDAQAVKILNYMNSIATAGDWNTNTEETIRQEFSNFVNIKSGTPQGLAGSSRNIIAYVNKWYTTSIAGDLGTAIRNAIHSETYVTLADGKVASLKDIANYPVGLPDGASVMTWNSTHSKFEYDEIKWDATQSKYVYVATHDKFANYVYPAERFFYANSRIYTSADSRKSDYTKDTWNAVLATYENKGTDYKRVFVASTTRSVAIKNPLRYGAAGLEIRIKANAEKGYLQDVDEEDTNRNVTLGATTFPLTAIIVSSQVEQNYCFEPVNQNDANEKVIYDTSLDKRYLGANTTTYSAPVYTIGLQTKDYLSMKVVLEFENNSAKDFISDNGVIYRGTKFYMLANVIPDGEQGKYKRVMTRGHMTTVNLEIRSLKSAYNALPDLTSDKLRLFDTVVAGIREWQTGQTGDHEVNNW